MLGFEHPSHMVTHPSTDEAQCCLSLEISKNDLGKKEEYEKKGLEAAVTLVTRDLKIQTGIIQLVHAIISSDLQRL